MELQGGSDLCMSAQISAMVTYYFFTLFYWARGRNQLVDDSRCHFANERHDSYPQIRGSELDTRNINGKHYGINQT